MLLPVLIASTAHAEWQVFGPSDGLSGTVTGLLAGDRPGPGDLLPRDRLEARGVRAAGREEEREGARGGGARKERAAPGGEGRGEEIEVAHGVP